MDLNKTIELSILEATQLMPSSGINPFTMVCLESKDFPEIFTPLYHHSPLLLFVLLKSDFSEEDLEDYAKKSKEYQTIPEINKNTFIKMFRAKFQDSNNIEQWKEMIASIAMGLLNHLVKTKDIYFDPINIDLSDINKLLKFTSKNLKVSQIYNIYLIN